MSIRENIKTWWAAKRAAKSFMALLSTFTETERYDLIQLVKNKDRASAIKSWSVTHDDGILMNDPKTEADLLMKDQNVNVGTVVRVLSEAIFVLPVDIMEVEVIAGSTRYIDDNDHPANAVFKNPNPDHSYTDFMMVLVDSYVSDGNFYASIERPTADVFELWPQNPKTVDIKLDKSGRLKGYRCKRGDKTVWYDRDEIIHIRNLAPDKLFKGVSRFNSARDEVLMDIYANMFNKALFKNGVWPGTTIFPEHELNDDQHKMLLDALRAQHQGADKAFKTFVSRFPGKLDTGKNDQKDMGFKDQYEMDREKIFSTGGVPPALAGVMRYANYANMLAQELSFHNNTVRPLLAIFEAAFNKQFIWKYFDEDHVVKFNTSEVPALQGDPVEKCTVHCNYVNKGVLTINEVREELGREPLEETDNPDDGTDESDDQSTNDDVPFPKDEEDEATDALYKFFRQQRKRVIDRIDQYSNGGHQMWAMWDYDKCANEFFSWGEEKKALFNTMTPIIKDVIRKQGVAYYEMFSKDKLATSRFKFDGKEIEAVIYKLGQQLDMLNAYSLDMIKSLLEDGDKYGWTLPQLSKQIKQMFTYDRAKKAIKRLMKHTVKISKALAWGQLNIG